MSMPRHLLAAALIVTTGLSALAQTPTSGAAPASSGSGARVPTTVARRTGFGEIRGAALSATNGALPKSVVRLRDTRTGRLSGTKLTDETGLFVFDRVEPGNYVVELVGDREKVLAASQLITVDSDVVSTIVKLPIKTLALGGLLGNNVSAAAIVAATAAAAGVLSVRASDCVSPPCEK